MPNRRDFVISAMGLMLAGLSAERLTARARERITVYKSKTCGCCAKWVEHLEASGFAPLIHDEESMDAIKDRLGVPGDLRSCHTALAGKYLIEGHVPAREIRKLLAERPKVAGLAVPGMPSGTPGMAQSQADEANFTVLAFQPDGSSYSFARY
jgi:hypothetical protein